MKRAALAILIGAGLFILSGCTGTFGGADALPDGGGDSNAVFEEAVPAPRFTAALADGATVESEDLFSGRVSLVHFMASWCTQCADQADVLTETAEAYGDEVQVVYIDSTGDEPDALQSFLNDNASDVPVVVDEDGSIFTRYAIVEPPVVALIDANGGIVRMWPGGATRDQLDADLTSLLG